MNQELELFRTYTKLAIVELNREGSVFGIFYGYRKLPSISPWGLQSNLDSIAQTLKEGGAIAIA